jgi:hypothetical protein
MANWGSLWFRKMAQQKQMVLKMAGNSSVLLQQSLRDKFQSADAQVTS